MSDQRAFNEWAVRGGLVLVSLTAVLGGAEIVIRITGWAPQVQRIEIYDGLYHSTDLPDLPYAPTPGRGIFNAFGIRDRERAPTPLADGIRIVALGDSVLFAGGSSLEQMFTTQLERHLRRAGDRFAGSPLAKTPRASSADAKGRTK